MALDTPAKKATPAPGAAAPPPPAGNGRKIGLMVVLGILIAMLGYDYIVLAPAATKTKDKLDAFVDEKNRAGIAPGKEGEKRDRSDYLVTSEDVKKTIGWAPTSRNVNDFYTVEYYNFWGAIPIRRHYIAVVYQTGKDGKPDLYSSHYVNTNPPEEDLPKDPTKQPKTDPKSVKLDPSAVPGPPSIRPMEGDSISPDSITPPKPTEPKEENPTPETDEKPAEPKAEESKPEEPKADAAPEDAASADK